MISELNNESIDSDGYNLKSGDDDEGENQKTAILITQFTIQCQLRSECLFYGIRLVCFAMSLVFGVEMFYSFAMITHLFHMEYMSQSWFLRTLHGGGHICVFCQQSDYFWVLCES
jgi:hypothetical protein